MDRSASVDRAPLRSQLDLCIQSFEKSCRILRCTTLYGQVARFSELRDSHAAEKLLATNHTH